MTDHNTADRLRTIAEGPALDLPPVHWEAPIKSTSAVVRWGALPWEDAGTDGVPNVYLCAYETSNIDGPFIEVGEERYALAEARIVLDRLASAIAMAEEVAR